MTKVLTEFEQSRLAELEQAFELFNQTSSQLTLAYEALQQQVYDLQQQLAASQQEKLRVGERLEQLLNLLPAGVIVLNSADVIVEMNPSAQQILGYDALGRIWDVVVRNVFLVQNDAGELITHDQQVYQLSESPLNMAQPAAQPPSLGRILLIQDVTTARELQGHISRHQRLDSMGEMAASLAHQIRTPLASALLYVSQLSKDSLDAEKRRAFTDKSLNSLRHLESLVKDMLQYAKGGRAHDQTFELSELFLQLGSTLEPFVKRMNGELVLPNDIMPRAIVGDIDGIITALQNLIVNAMEIQGLQGRVEVRLSLVNQDKIAISVSDQGPGIPDELKEKIFEPFYTSRAQGTGLGLAVVRAVAEAHNGEVFVKSVLGSGSTFTLVLPLVNNVLDTND